MASVSLFVLMREACLKRHFFFSRIVLLLRVVPIPSGLFFVFQTETEGNKHMLCTYTDWSLSRPIVQGTRLARPFDSPKQTIGLFRLFPQ